MICPVAEQGAAYSRHTPSAEEKLNKLPTSFQCDVVILGGGPAGAAAALALRQHAPSLSVALIEQTSYDQLRIGETLPPVVQPLLEQLGVWDTFLNEGHIPAYGTSTAWGSDRLLDNEFIYHPMGRGWHLDRTRFDAMLTREAENRGVAVYSGARFTGSQRLGGEGRRRIAVLAENGDEISVEAAFVVDATGRRSVFAAGQGIRKVLLDHLLGVFIFFSLQEGAELKNTYTLVEAWEKGWWYSALVPGGKIAVACMSDTDIIKKHGLNSSGGWFDCMSQTHHIKERLKLAVPVTQPRVYPAASHRLERMSGENWLAVGDAATTFDPLSSQGIFKGLRSGIMASYAIGDYFKGRSSGLEKYEAVLAKEFEEYLITRAYFYGQERRWENSAFWQRRYEHITLDPSQIVRLSDQVRQPAAIEKLSMHLPVSDLKLLCQICSVPRQAQEVVSEFKTRNNLASDKRIILTLQYLLQEGFVKYCDEKTDASLKPIDFYCSPAG